MSGLRGTEGQRENDKEENWNTIFRAGSGSVGGDACTRLGGVGRSLALSTAPHPF